VEIYFPDAERRRLFCTGSALRARFGDALAETICSRLQLLKKARTLALVPVRAPIDRRNDIQHPGSYTVALGAGHRLIFEAVDSNLAATACTNPDEIHAVRVITVAEVPNKDSEK
jgi:hypothetical protein